MDNRERSREETKALRLEVLRTRGRHFEIYLGIFPQEVVSVTAVDTPSAASKSSRLLKTCFSFSFLKGEE